MSNNATPNKPVPPRFNHLQAEPVPISFASPQQIAAFTAGGGFNNPWMKTSMPSFMPSMNTGFNSMNNATYQQHTVQPMSPSTSTASAAAASASSKPASSNSNVFKPLPPQDIDLNTFKGFKFVTLDPLQLETRDAYEKVSDNCQWSMCEGQEDRCINEIREKFANKRIFLISSGSLGARIVPQIHALPQVYAIYIYCINVKAHQEWAAKYDKVRVVCDNDDRDLLPRLAIDLAQSNIDWGNAFLKQGTRDKAKEKFQLAYDKLSNHARNYTHDPAMDVEIKNKLEECK
jgi:hypothetical protein